MPYGAAMTRPDPAFSSLVAGDAWLAEASGWASAAVAARGGRVLEVRRHRVRPWSAQLVISTDLDGAEHRLWFKANCAAQSFEPALQRALAAALPETVDAPFAIDAPRGWMLTVDRGATLRERREPGADDWTEVVETWVGVQRATTGLAGELASLGVPDCSPATAPERFELMLARVGSLPHGHPSAVDAETAAALAGARGAVDRAAAALGASGLPPALQHGDLHPGNVFAPPGTRLRVFDFGDAQWSHPVEALLVPCAVMEHAGLDASAAERVFRAGWADVAAFDDEEWRELLAAATIVHAVNRAATWWDCLRDADDAETAEWGEAMLRHLSRVLEHDPAR